MAARLPALSYEDALAAMNAPSENDIRVNPDDADQVERDMPKTWVRLQTPNDTFFKRRSPPLPDDA